MKFIGKIFKKKSKRNDISSERLTKHEHKELVVLCQKALSTKKLTIAKSSAIFNWFNLDFNRALDPVASELFYHCCGVEESGEVCLTNSMKDCITHIVNTIENPSPRIIPESTNEFEPFQKLRIRYRNKNGDVTDRDIIFIKSEIRQIKKLNTDIYAICINSKYALQFIKERIVSFETLPA